MIKISFLVDVVHCGLFVEEVERLVATRPRWRKTGVHVVLLVRGPMPIQQSSFHLHFHGHIIGVLIRRDLVFHGFQFSQYDTLDLRSVADIASCPHAVAERPLVEKVTGLVHFILRALQILRHDTPDSFHIALVAVYIRVIRRP
jgi:hypothetical protein